MKKEKIYTLLLFIIFIVICSYPLFINLGNLSVRIWDEARNGINAMEMLNDHQYMVTHFDGVPDMWNTKPPFFIWMVALSMKFLGTTTFALRFPSALSCLAIMIYCFWFCKKHLDSVWIGILSGFVLVTSIGFIDNHVARNGDFDAMLSMWMFFYSTQFYIYLEHKNKKPLNLFALFLCLAILTKGIAGCLFLPGLLIFALTDKNYFPFFKTKRFYIIPFIGLFIGISYYFIRELYNPGYINAVLKNEITGRYLETNEGHTESTWYYLNLLTGSHFKYWMYFIPLSFILITLRANSTLKRISLFLFVQISFYLILLTISSTKLPWYDAPLFPFFAMFIAIGIIQVFIEFKKITFIKNVYLKGMIFSIFCAIIFIIPIQNILGTSIQGEKEIYYPSLFYGDFINYVYAEFPRQKKLIVSSDKYNPHLIFYAIVHRNKHQSIELISSSDSLQKNDSIIICEKNMSPKLSAGLMYDTLLQEGNLKYFMRVVPDSDHVNRKPDLFLSKINEIESDPEWLFNINDKARKNDIDFERQLILDALWDLNREKKITPQLYLNLKKYALK